MPPDVEEDGAWKAERRADLRATYPDEPKPEYASLAAGATWWQARAAGRQGDAAKERAGFEKVIGDFPDSSYAWLASPARGRAWGLRRPAQASAAMGSSRDAPRGVGRGTGC